MYVCVSVYDMLAYKRMGFFIGKMKEYTADLEHQLVRKPHHCTLGLVSNHEQLQHLPLEQTVPATRQ